MAPSEKPGFAPAISAIILAGGKSSRLGVDKAFLRLEGRPLVARTIDKLSALSKDLIVVTNSPERYGPLALPVRLVPDERPGEGSLMGIYSGLRAARHSHALAVACDMPFLDLPLLRYMIGLAAGYDVVVPRIGDMAEPLHAIYSRACLPMMERLFAEGRRQIVAFFHEARVRFVEEAEIDRFDSRRLAFLNVNTPEDWEQAKRLLEACKQERPPG